MVVRYEGHLGIGHVYMDVTEALLGPVEAVLKGFMISKDSKGYTKKGSASEKRRLVRATRV